MIRLSKNFIFNPAQIRVLGIKCSFHNIIKILNILDFEWIIMTVDSVAKESSLLPLINKYRLTHFEKNRKENMEISVVTRYDVAEEILNRAINETPENIFIVGLPDAASCNRCLRYPYGELVTMGITDVFVSISLDENALLISMNKDLTSSQGVYRVYRKIKALRFS